MRFPTCAGCVFANPLPEDALRRVREDLEADRLPHLAWDTSEAPEELELWNCVRTHDFDNDGAARIRCAKDRCGNGLWLTEAIFQAAGQQAPTPEQGGGPFIDYASAVRVLNTGRVQVVSPGIAVPLGPDGKPMM